MTAEPIRWRSFASGRLTRRQILEALCRQERKGEVIEVSKISKYQFPKPHLFLNLNLLCAKNQMASVSRNRVSRPIPKMRPLRDRQKFGTVSYVTGVEGIRAGLCNREAVCAQ